MAKGHSFYNKDSQLCPLKIVVTRWQGLEKGGMFTWFQLIFLLVARQTNNKPVKRRYSAKEVQNSLIPCWQKRIYGRNKNRIREGTKRPAVEGN